MREWYLDIKRARVVVLLVQAKLLVKRLVNSKFSIFGINVVSNREL